MVSTAGVMLWLGLSAATCLGWVAQSSGVGRGGKAVVRHSSLREKQRGNVAGNFFVDEACIDCGACGHMVTGIFGRKGFKYVVAKQPENDEEEMKVLQAMTMCPTGSIRMEEPSPALEEAFASFPLEIDPEVLPGVYHVGFHSMETYGNAPYLIVREGGNVLVDVARYNAGLADRIEALGGVSYLVMTSLENVDGHEAWKARFPGMLRIMHEHDIRPETEGVEQVLQGRGPYEIDEEDEENGDSAAALDGQEGQGDGLRILFTPGRTFGSLCVWYRPQGGSEAALFSGGHLGYNQRLECIDGFSGFNRGGIERQADSMRKLTDPTVCEDWTWLLPGRGWRHHFDSPVEMRSAVTLAAAEFQRRGRVLK